MSRIQIVNTAKGFIGMKANERQMLIDWYNAQAPIPRGVSANIKQAWCALFASYCYGVNGFSEIRELSCGKMIERAKQLGWWVEDDDHEAHLGDMIMYDWNDSGRGDNKSWPDHVGIISDVSGHMYRVIEGNYNRKVAMREVIKNQRYIRGFICAPIGGTVPQGQGAYVSVAYEVIKGYYGNGLVRKKRLQAAGYDCERVQRIVNAIVKGEDYSGL